MKLTKTLAITLLTGTMVVGTIGCSNTQPTTINFNSDTPKIEQYKDDHHNTNTKDNTPVESTTPQKSQKTPTTTQPKTAQPKTTTKSNNKQQKNTQSTKEQPNKEQPNNKQPEPETEVENPGFEYPRCPLCGEYVTTDSAYFARRPAHYVCARNYGEAHHLIRDYSIPLIVEPSASNNSSTENNNNNTTAEPNNTTTEGDEINE